MLRDTYATIATVQVGTEYIGASGVQSFQNSHYRDFNPTNLIGGLRMTTTAYKQSGAMQWRMRPGDFTATTLQVPATDPLT